jgi:hypothetical protein
MRERVVRVAVVVPRLVVALYFGSQAVASLIYYDVYASAALHLLRYVVGPGMIALLFLLTAVLMPRHLALQIGTCGLGALAGLFAYEAFVTLRSLPKMSAFIDTPAAAAQAAEERVPDYTLGSLNPSIGTGVLREAMLGGMPHAPTYLCADGGTPVVYRADRYGFNNDDEAYERPIDILVLGDSFIEGTCLPPGKDVVARLREIHPGSVAMAVRGNGPLLELATLGRFGPSLRPPHVVMAFFEGNDWRNLEGELSTPWIAEALSPDADFGPAPAPAATVDRAREVLTARVRGGMSRRQMLRQEAPGLVRNFVLLGHTANALGLRYGAVPPDHPEFTQLLARGDHLARSWGGRLHLLYIPKIDRYFGLLPSGAARDVLRGKVLEAAAAAGVPVIDMVDLLDGVDNPLSVYDLADAHFSEEGARLAAQAIAKHLAAATFQNGQSASPARDTTGAR